MCARDASQPVGRGQRTACQGWFSHSLVWVPGIELRVASLGGKYLYWLSHVTNPHRQTDRQTNERTNKQAPFALRFVLGLLSLISPYPTPTSHLSLKVSLYALSCGWLFNTDACHLLHVRSPLPQRGWQPQAPHGPWGQECVVLHTAAARCGPTQHGTRFLPCHLGLCLACSSLHSGFCPLGFNADYGSSWQPLGPGGHLFPSSGRSSAVPPHPPC